MEEAEGEKLLQPKGMMRSSMLIVYSVPAARMVPRAHPQGHLFRVGVHLECVFRDLPLEGVTS